MTQSLLIIQTRIDNLSLNWLSSLSGAGRIKTKEMVIDVHRERSTIASKH